MSAPTSRPRAWESLLERYERATHEFHPAQARALGLHEFDGLLSPLDRGAREQRRRFLTDMLGEVGARPAGLDARLFQHALRSELWQLTVMRREETDPLHAAMLMEPSVYIKREYAPWSQRADALLRHLLAVPGFLADAAACLERELCRPALDVALEVFTGLEGFLGREIPEAIAREGGAPTGLDGALERARTAVQAHLRFLREQCLPRARQEFALGAEGYAGMLRDGEGLDIDVATMLAVGEKDLQRNSEALQEIIAQLAPDRHPREFVEELAHDHPSASSLLDAAREIVLEIGRFLAEKPLVTVPAEDGLLIEETPPYERWAFAALDSPGVFDRPGLPSFYYITPPENDWGQERSEAWLQLFNRNSLRVISVHEVVPGHHLHALHLRRARSRATQLFSTSYHFWEGWAHYTEELMIEQGYGAADPRLELMQRIEALHRDARLLCSAWMHTQGMSVGDAARFFEDRTFCPPEPALKEAQRGTFDPQYVGYTLGKLVLLKLREDVRAREGSSFEMRAFHDRVLSVGAPPMSLLREEVFELRDGALL